MESTTRDRDHALTLAKSSDVDVPFSVKLGTLQGNQKKKTTTELLNSPESRHAGFQQDELSDLYIVCQLWADNKPLSIPIQTAHKNFSKSYSWSESIEFPLQYRDLPLSSLLTCTIYDSKGPPSTTSAYPVGGSTLRLFGKKRTIKKGKQRLFVWEGLHADGRDQTSTPSKVEFGSKANDEMGRLESLVKKHERGDLPRVNWLDKLAFRKIEQIHAAESQKTNKLFLYIDLPRFDFPIVFSEPLYPPPLLKSAMPTNPAAPVPSANQPGYDTSVNVLLDSDLVTIIDPEIARENIVEAKHRRLVRSYRTGPLDRELKPNAKIRDELNVILRYPPTHQLSPVQRDLIWRFRFYLSKDKRGLTKFLKSVEWSDQAEVKQAVEVLLPMWTDIEMDDVLELLGPGEAFRDRRVRSYAVKQISRVDDDELMLYLLQLVQALKFDPDPNQIKEKSHTRSKQSRNHHHRHQHGQSPRDRNASSSATPTTTSELVTLADFLIDRSVKNPVLGNHFHWYLMIETDDKQMGKMYSKVAFNYMSRIVDQPGGDARRDTLKRQGEFVHKLSELAKEIRSSKDTRQKKIERLRGVIQDTKSQLGSFRELPLPLDATIQIIGIDPQASSVFKSNLFPLKLQLITENHSHYPIIFKNGDDLRQDQLVIQLFTLMDRLLRKENLDLKLLPYRVLATAPVDGMVQFVPSKTLDAISSEYGSVVNYLREHHPDEGSVGTYGILPSILETYIKSCAGYCVVTYILGVGDRHLDNLLLSPDGQFFHVDFGYILGRDPKPFPPAVKICKEMVDAMGGMQSPHYSRFKNLCHTSFSILRKNAGLIINLVALMVDANIPDIKLEPDKAVTKLQDKFMLDVSEEEAMNNFDALLNDIPSWGAVLDRIHAAAQYFRT